MDWILNWAETLKAGTEEAGGKGWNLGQLYDYGFTLPRGAVLKASAHGLFLKSLSFKTPITLDLSRVPTDIEKDLLILRNQIQAASLPLEVERELREFLRQQGWEETPLAVRSSASLEDSGLWSFAGIHESYLNQKGVVNILQAVKNCYASLWTTRAVAYRQKMQIPLDKLKMAVVLMEMAEATASGIGFTCDPRSGRKDLLVINAGYGLGESIVGGQSEPDEYLLDSRTFVPLILSKKTGRKTSQTINLPEGGTQRVPLSPEESSRQVLTDEHIIQLGLLLLRVHDALGDDGDPVDVEWAWNGKTFTLLQARPVTSLPRYTFPALKNQPDYWSNANIKDAIPMVQTQLTRKMFRNMVQALLNKPFDMAGYQRPEGISYYRLYQGRGYFNLSVLQWAYYDCIGMHPSITNRLTGGHQPEIQIPDEGKAFSRMKILRNWRILRLAIPSLKALKMAPHIFHKNRSYCRKWRDMEQIPLSSRETLAALEELYAHSLGLTPTIAIINGMSGMPLVRLSELLKQRFPGREAALTNALMAGKGQIVTAEQGYQVISLAEIAREDPEALAFFQEDPFIPLSWQEKMDDRSEFKMGFIQYLKDFGHRAVYEAEILNPRWKEDPSYQLEIIRSLIPTADLKALQAKQKNIRDKAWNEIKSKVPVYLQWAIQFQLHQAVKGAELREEAKSEMARLLLPLRILSRKLGETLAQRGILENWEDVYYCQWAEILSILKEIWDGKGLKKLVLKRKRLRAYQETLAAPDLIIDDTPQLIKASTLPVKGNYYSGLGGAPGRATGKARLIHHPSEGNRLEVGDILIAPSTDPGWSPLFLKASALVMESGGSLSHGAIIAREYGIPAVLNIPGIMTRLKEGQTLTVDGDEGRVYLST